MGTEEGKRVAEGGIANEILNYGDTTPISGFQIRVGIGENAKV